MNIPEGLGFSIVSTLKDTSLNPARYWLTTSDLIYDVDSNLSQLEINNNNKLIHNNMSLAINKNSFDILNLKNDFLSVKDAADISAENARKAELFARDTAHTAGLIYSALSSLNPVQEGALALGLRVVQLEEDTDYLAKRTEVIELSDLISEKAWDELNLHPDQLLEYLSIHEGGFIDIYEGEDTPPGPGPEPEHGSIYHTETQELEIDGIIYSDGSLLLNATISNDGILTL